MSLFRRDEPPSDSSPKTERATPDLGATAGAAGHVAAGSRIEGTLTGTADWAVDGELAGAIRISGKVTIGPGGQVEGTLEARAIRIAGRVVGDVVATERVEVVAQGHLEGNISARRIVIAEGAFFKGRVAMAEPPPKSGAKERKH